MEKFAMKKIAILAGAILGFATAPLMAQMADLPGTVATPIAGGPVQTESGLVDGKMLANGVKAWLGVPYVKAPVGDLRWKEPQPIRWNGVYHADRKMPSCIQILRPHNINHYFGEEATGEDCLYMNIWAPGNATAASKLPVIVFIYGGGSTVGSSGMALYGGDEVAKRGAVFVNFNYRLGILGFMAHPELTAESPHHASGNYAYLDQNAALKWIHDNIARFGGDPAKVVITGQSAGAGSVVQQIFSPLSHGLFRGAMMSSGCNWGTSNTPLADAEKTGLEIQKRLGAANIADMRQVPADHLLAIQNETQLGVSVEGVRVGGDMDGYFMPKSQMAILAAHENSDVPIIASFNHDEASNAFKTAKTVAEYNATAQKVYGDKAAEFLKLYPVKTDADVWRVGGQVAREGGLETSARKCAVLQAQYNKSPAFIDTYSRAHPYTPGVKIADQDTATIGAYHTSDIPYWFGTQDTFNMFRRERDWTPYDRELSQKMTAMLIALANTGDPSIPGQTWPAWSAKNEQKIEFGNDKIEVVKLNTKGMDFLATNAPARALPATPRAGLPGQPRD